MRKNSQGHRFASSWGGKSAGESGEMCGTLAPTSGQICVWGAWGVASQCDGQPHTSVPLLSFLSIGPVLPYSVMHPPDLTRLSLLAPLPWVKIFHLTDQGHT